jgi:hypothetical protein
MVNALASRWAPLFLRHIDHKVVALRKLPLRSDHDAIHSELRHAAGQMQSRDKCEITSPQPKFCQCLRRVTETRASGVLRLGPP